MGWLSRSRGGRRSLKTKRKAFRALSFAESLEPRVVLSADLASALDDDPSLAAAIEGSPLASGDLFALTPSISNGTWTQMSNGAPGSLGTMMLLSDGRVFAQGGGTSSTFYALTPDSSGSYSTGSWSSLASMGTQRLYTASNVLRDGRVFVLGGEYSGPNGAQNWTNTGEIYDPVSNSWMVIPNHPDSQFGDVPTAILPDGTLLAGSLFSASTYIYHPDTNTWTTAATKLRGDRSDEETWVLLPDGSVLSYDVFASVGNSTGSAQRYIPATNTWVDAGVVPVVMSDSSVGYELGPAHLLPDGRVLVVGANNLTALYNFATNTWTAGPTLPAGMGADDAPGAELPNGHVIFAADTTLFKAPTQLFDFDPATNGVTLLTNLPSGLNSILAGSAAFTTRMLVLPTGQILFSSGSSRPWLFTPSDPVIETSRPTITSIAPNADGSFTLTGTQLNGVSEGASYGDDAEVSSNYPLVRLTSTSGTVYYARTYNWSNTGVATGTLPVTTQFRTPAGLPNGNYTLEVVANGIPSAPVSFAQPFQFSVIASTPSKNSIISAPPTSFVINFSHAIDPATLAASDLTVNGIAASSVALSSDHFTATFTYSTSPVTTQGLQTMAMVAGAVAREGLPGTTVVAYSASFRYDVTPLQVVSTSPGVGGVFTLPAPFTFDLTLNEPILPSSVTTSSLVLGGVSGASVSNATVLPGNTTIRFTISGITTETPLTASMLAGAIQDQFGNPGKAFSGNYSTDYSTVAVPTPMTARSPVGSVIFESNVAGAIAASNDTDAFTLLANPSQTISVYVTATTSTFQPQVQLLDFNDQVVGSGIASAPGKPVLIQSLSLGGSAASVYKIVVSGVSGSLGGYTVQVLLNAALEEEGRVGSVTNNSLATAQNLNPSFVTPSSLTPTAQRGAVLGQTDDLGAYGASSVPYAFDDISATGTSVAFTDVDDGSTSISINFGFTFFGTTYSSLFVGANGNVTFGSSSTAYSNTDLSSSPTPATIAPLWDDLYVGGTANSKVVYQTKGIGSAAQLIVQWNDISYFNDSPRAGGLTFQLILGADQTIRFNYLNLATGGSNQNAKSATVGLKAAGTVTGNSVLLIQKDAGPTDLVNSQRSILIAQLPVPADYYSFSLAALDAATLVISTAATSTIKLELLDGTGTVLATAATTGSSTLLKSITNAAATATGTYYARVSGAVGTTYSLVVLRNTIFDIENNSTLATAQALGASKGALGRVSGVTGSSDEDWFQLNITTVGSSITATTAVPFLGSGNYQSPLLAHLELYNPQGTRVATGRVLDSKNETITFTTLLTGRYWVRVTGKAQTQGEYFVSVIVTPLTTVQTFTIDDGTAQRSRIRSLTLDFDGSVTTAPASAFTLTRLSDNSVIPVTASAPVLLAGGKSRVVLTFSGSSLEFGSLADGQYQLAINGNLLVDSLGRKVDAAGSGVLGSSTTRTFKRFFGDANGDGLVDSVDYLAFRNAYLSGVVTTANSIYDYDGDGHFTAADLQAFTNNMRKRVLS